MLVAKYKFDKSIYENLIPVFNDGYNGYTISDEIDSGNSNYIIRTIECDALPTKMRFGTSLSSSEYVEGKEIALLEVIDINISELTSMYQMFKYCKNLTSIDASNWNTSNVTDMAALFMNCPKLTSLDVSNFDTSKVTKMDYMFYNCNKLTSLDVSNFDTSKVTKMDYMFYNCSSLQYVRCNNVSTISKLAPLLYNRTSSTQGKIITTSSTNVDTTTLSSRNWSLDTSSGTKLAEYKYDKSIWNYFIPEFNEGYSGYFCNDRIEDEVNSPNVVTREIVGYGGLPTLMRFGRVYVEGESATDNKTDSLLEVLDMNTSGLTSCSDMFRYNTNLTSITCEWDTSNVTNMGNMFVACTNLTSLDVSNFNTSNVTIMNHMFNSCYKLTSLNMSNWNTSNVISIVYMFYGCSNLTSLDLSSFDTSNVTTMSGTFYNCDKLTSIDVSNWNTSNVSNMSNMFRSCFNLISVDVSNWDTGNVTNMSHMFYYCFKLTLLDVSNFNTSNVTDMQYMFHGCQSLTSLDLSNWDTNKLTYLYTIFADCTNLASLNLSNWNVSNIKDLRYLVTGCKKLKTLDISNWNFNSSISFTQNFENTPLLKDIGMLYCSQDTINKLIPLITDGSKTIWVQDTKASDYTATDYVTIKDYKEDNRTLYLNSPLLEGDEIVNKEGKLYHYHKMGSVVFDGSEFWIEYSNKDTYMNFRISAITNIAFCNNTSEIVNMISNNFSTRSLNHIADYNIEGVAVGTTSKITISIDKTKLSTTDVDGFKQWLSENPTTIVYELAEPYYELISDDPLIVQSYVEGKLDTSSIITPTSIQSIPYEEELTYLYTSTQYCIQFNSTANCTVDITLGGTKVENKSVSVGLNKIYITTPSTLVDNKLIINAKGNATISEVVVVNSNAEFDYFDGLKSSFEDCLVTDVDNENYGKYEVGVKIVGKNKFKGYNEFIRIRKEQYYLLSSDITEGATRAYITMYDKDFNDITTSNYAKLDSVSISYGRYRLYLNHWRYITGADSVQLKTRIKFSNNVRYIKIGWGWESKSSEVQYNNVILEECEQKTSNPIPYEPYKETNATIYLNSPLLQGDRIEVVDGKLCHYHKMGSVVLDGSEKWSNTLNNTPYTYYYLQLVPLVVENPVIALCDTLPINPNIQDNDRYDGSSGLRIVGANRSQCRIRVPHCDTLESFKQWLQQNPITVVYELANPYYEDITPIQSSFVISTVSEGDMEIITDLPIKSNITYLTNITSAVLMEQQLDELDNSTESLTNIVEDEINE